MEPEFAQHGFTYYLDTVGDGSGTKQCVADYSSSEQQFKLTCQEGEELFVRRMIPFLQCNGTAAAAGYGPGSALANGFLIEVRRPDDTIFRELTNGIPIKTNAGWSRQCYDATRKTWGAGDDVVVARYSFEIGTGLPIHLIPGWSLVVLARDDFSTDFTEQTFQVQGKVVYQ